MQQIKVFQIIGNLGIGGAERLVVNLLSYLEQTLYQPVCICLGNSSGTHYERLVHKLQIPLYFLGKGNELDLKTYKQLGSLFKKYRPQIVHTHLRGLSYAYPWTIRYQTPVRVHTIHSVAGKEMPPKGIGRLAWLLAFRYRLGGVVPVAIAKEVQRTIQQVYHYRHAPLIPNGIPTTEYTPDSQRRFLWRQRHQIESDAVVFVSVGRLVSLKNHALLLNAFAKVESTRHIYLLLVGGGDLENAIRQQIHQLNLQDRVRLLGVRADIPDILNASDIFVLSSKWEGNPMSVQEAMASGLPVISTAVGGVPELVNDGVSGLLVPSEDEEALVHAMQKLVDNPDLRQQMGDSALAHAKAHFDIQQIVRLYEKLYQHILQGKSLASFPNE